MARTLEQLKKQYNFSAADQKRGMGFGGGHRGGNPGMTGKPKELKKTLSRLIKYVYPYRFRFIGVLLCMFISTASSLVGAYMLAPIIDKIAQTVTGYIIEPGPFAKIINNFILSVSPSASADVMTYIFIALAILGSIYLVGILTTYLQNRLMLSISQGTVENIRNDLFNHLQKLNVKYFHDHPTGEIMSRFTNDIDNIDLMLNNSLTSIISGIVTLLGTFFFMITTNWILTLVTIVFIPQS